MTQQEYRPTLISWNITQRCNLACAHCYLDASQMAGQGELGPGEALQVVEAIAAFSPGAMLVLSGGEPLLRPDLLPVASHATCLGLRVVVGSNGYLLTPEWASRLAEAGVLGIGLSLDSLEAQVHDSFRGCAGAWQRTVAGIAAAQKAGLQVQLQATITQANRHEVARLAEFAACQGAAAFNLFFLICTGRGQRASDLTPQQYEETLQELVGLQARYPDMMVRARCAPHLVRLTSSPAAGVGCLAATYYCRITPQGEVTPCPYLPLSGGTLRQWDLGQIWDSDLFASFRYGGLKGRCGRCEFAKSCGGCRARAYAASGDCLGEDPYCLYEPGPARGQTVDPQWTPQAMERLARAPAFVRPVARRLVERYAREKGYHYITPEVLAEARHQAGDRHPGPV